MQASFKVQFNGKFRRFNLEEITFENLVNTIGKKFGLDRSAVAVSYFDDEGDCININSDFELNEAVQYALPAKCLKLLVDVPKVETTPVEAVVATPQEVPEPLIIEPQVISDAATEATELEVEEKVHRKQSVLKAKKQKSRQRARRALKREKALARRQLNKIKKEKRAAKAPRSVKNKKVCSPRQYMTRVIAHVNYPTGQEIAPNVNFSKVWKLRNTGTLYWNLDFKIVRVSKDENNFDAPEYVVLNREVAPGAEYEVSIPLRAPNQPGNYESAWRLVNGVGKRFGPRFACKLVVVDNDAITEQDPAASEVTDKKARSAERRQQRAEKFAMYGEQLTKIRSLGMKATARHVRLLEKFDGNVDQVIASITARKNSAKLA